MNEGAVFQPSQLEQVREGMTVLDEAGRRLGRVKRLRMGDPDAVTTAGQSGARESVGITVAPAGSPGGTTAFGGAAPIMGGIGTDPDVPDPLWTRLRRVGFIEVEDSELHGSDAYIAGDRIADVSGDTVRLRPRVSASTASAHAEPMFRTHVGEARYVTKSSTAVGRNVWTAAAGGLAVTGVVGAGGAWLFRRRQRQARLDARLRRALQSIGDRLPDEDRTSAGGIGGGLLLVMLVAATLASRVRRQAPVPPDVDSLREDAVGRAQALPRRATRAGGGLVLGALALGLTVLWRRRTPEQKPAYIGTPGVESAAGRDRTRSGELPPDYGIERGRM